MTSVTIEDLERLEDLMNEAREARIKAGIAYAQAAADEKFLERLLQMLKSVEQTA